MPNLEAEVVVIKIFEREFKIKCPEGKVAELQDAVKYLDKKMQEVRHGDRSITIDRIAITAALNITHELIIEKKRLKTSSNSDEVLKKRFLSLQQKIDQALANPS